MAPQAELPRTSESQERLDESARMQDAIDQAKTKSALTTLQKRLLSAAILLPIAAVALWLGGRAWAGLIFLFALTMAWEWCAICATRRDTQIPWAAGHITLTSLIVLATVTIAFLPSLLPMDFPTASVWGVLVIGVVLSTISAWPSRGVAALWVGLGLFYVVPACLGALMIRAEAPDGLPTTFWIVALVVATDTGAYAAGRSIGGPKLAPRISPNKTWAGLAGGVISAGLVGWIMTHFVSLQTPWMLIPISCALAVVEQLGDLFKSFFKRYFGVKDSGRIIPGHGGVLDRVDGLLAVILTVAGFELLMGGGIFRWL